MATGRRAERKGKSVTKSLAGRKEKPCRVGDTEKPRAKETSNRVGRNARLGYGRNGGEGQEWGGGQQEGSS